MAILSTETVLRVLEETKPSFQLTDVASLNLGFGWIYYGFARALRPQRVLVIGSKRGFAPICLALGMAHNEGHTIARVSCYGTALDSISTESLTFVDPSKSCDRGDNDHSFGEGFWDDPLATEQWFSSFGCAVSHECVDSDSFFKQNDQTFDVVLLDGSHTYEQAKRDLKNASMCLSPGGLLLMHDVHPNVALLDPTFGSQDAFREFAEPHTSKVAVPVFPGLGVIFDTREPTTSFSVDPT